MAADPVRLGVIGAGPWGRKVMASIERLAGMDLVCVASSNPETAEIIGPGCTIKDNWRDVAEAVDLDGVLICTPPQFHAEMTRAAVAAGNGVLVEKPLTLDVREARDLLEFVAESNGFVLVDHIYLFHPAYRELKKLGSTLGDIQAIRTRGGNIGPFRADTPPMWDYGSHDIAMCLDLMGKMPKKVIARRKGRRTFGDGEEGEVIAIQLRFAGGVVADINVGNAMTPNHRDLAVDFEEETVVFDNTASSKLIRRPLTEEAGVAVPVASTLPLDIALMALALGVRKKETSRASLELAVNVISVLQQCQDALGEV